MKEILCRHCCCILHEGSNWSKSRCDKNDYICNKCLKKKYQEIYKNDKQKKLTNSTKSYLKIKENGGFKYGNKQWAARYLASVKRNDRIKQREVCDFTVDEILTLISEDCTYCGLKKNNIGMDRINNKIGHLKSNVVPCCTICNTSRMSNFTHEEMKILGKTIRKILEQR